ncbi:hypothetical protein BC6307_04425 [Sutcliffiella cohnii]|uniref:Peptidase S9 prolyl oligopeptidase catalytic domain-containing protein n=1 Tax=Sutcliffiella cohnii TaxID=33932 RepID=A0A223KMF0_9BACI|nr:prolyl oligopeptidase family serine peptidase [Sutcliffiella cohnii]AST90576.1 hypothetical protein BC6307_04425 [Sutcliffiella cohnii]
MIHIEKRKIKEIPLLEVYDQSIKNEKAPTIFFFHGITSMKEMNLSYAYLMAEKGFRVVLPDSLYHGERGKRLQPHELAATFWKIVLTNITDVNTLRKVYIEEGKIEEARIGVAGTSMGAITTLGCLTQYSWIKAAVSLMGTPSYEQFALEKLNALKGQITLSEVEIAEALEQLKPFDLSKKPELLNGRPLYCWHGALDKEVPVHHIQKFAETIPEGSNVKLVIDPNGSHKVSKEGMYATANWFAEHL